MQSVSPRPLHPGIRVQHSTPSPGVSSANLQQGHNMLGHMPYMSNDWASNGALLSPVNFQQNLSGAGRHHKRASSGSSIASNGPPSPLDGTTTYPYIAQSDASDFNSPSNLDSLDNMLAASHSQTSKSLPTPVHTPTQHSFLPSEYSALHGLSSQDIQDVGQIAMKRSRPDLTDDDAASYGYSQGHHSVSSVSRNSPATPQTNYEGDFDDQKMMMHSGESAEDIQSWVDKYLRAGSATGFGPQMQNMQMFPEGLNYGGMQSSPVSSSNKISNRPAPLNIHHYRKVMSDRLQAANQDHLQARTQSPATSSPRDRSPFQNSPYMDSAAAQAQFNQAMNIRSGATGGNMMMAPQQSNAQTTETPKTISPKDTVLEYPDDDASSSLFPDQESSLQFQPRRESSNFSNSAFSANSQFYGNAYSTAGIPQQYPGFMSQQSRTSSNLQSLSEQTPDFHPTLASMESTVSERSQAPMTSSPQQTRRPQDTSSDKATKTQERGTQANVAKLEP
ncbi:MAG: hypothetical protein Q9227_001802 [Pyrenula ochraceoflavens]